MLDESVGIVSTSITLLGWPTSYLMNSNIVLNFPLQALSLASDKQG